MAIFFILAMLAAIVFCIGIWLGRHIDNSEDLCMTTQELALQAEAALATLLARRFGFWTDDDRTLRAALLVVRRLAES